MLQTSRITLRRLMSSNSNSVSKAKKVLRNANAVCFDVDSTVIQSEGIDDLAHYLGTFLSLYSLSHIILIQVHTTTTIRMNEFVKF